jgi:hypothetical protein
MLTFGSVALQIVLLYARLPMRIMSFFFLSIAGVMLIVSVTTGTSSSITTGNMAAWWSLLYQMGINGPTMMLLWPFVFHMSYMDKFMRSNYKSLYGLKVLKFLMKFIEGELKYNSSYENSKLMSVNNQTC